MKPAVGARAKSAVLAVAQGASTVWVGRAVRISQSTRDDKHEIVCKILPAQYVWQMTIYHIWYHHVPSSYIKNKQIGGLFQRVSISILADRILTYAKGAHMRLRFFLAGYPPIIEHGNGKSHRDDFPIYIPFI